MAIIAVAYDQKCHVNTFAKGEDFSPRRKVPAPFSLSTIIRIIFKEIRLLFHKIYLNIIIPQTRRVVLWIKTHQNYVYNF